MRIRVKEKAGNSWSGSFNVVVCAGVMGHMMRRRAGERVVDTAAVALHELLRVLRPGGFIVVTAPNMYRIHWLLDPRQLRRAIQSPLHLRNVAQSAEEGVDSREQGRHVPRDGTLRWTPLEWRRFLADEGLKIVRNRGIGFGPFSFFDRNLMSSERAVRLSVSLERRAA